MSIRVRGNGGRRRAATDTLVRSLGWRSSVVSKPIEYLIDWSRYLHVVGQVSPNAALADFNGVWQVNETPTPYESHVAYPPEVVQQIKMQPLRYELGSVDGGALYPKYVLANQSGIGMRSTPPPTTGHIAHSVIESIRMSGIIFISTGEPHGYNAAASILRAVEVYKNGETLGLYDFGSEYHMGHHYMPNDISKYTHKEVRFDLLSPVEAGPDDVVSVDFYVHVASVPPGFIGTPGNYWHSPAALALEQTLRTNGHITFTGSTARWKEKRGHKIVFSNNGPGGASELFIGAQDGWTSSATTSGIALTNHSLAQVVTFGYLQEIPFVEIYAPLLAPAAPRIRYRPVQSGEYMPMQDFGAFTVTYGVWDPDVETQFTERAVATPGVFESQWATPNVPFSSSYFAPFPESVSVVRV